MLTFVTRLCWNNNGWQKPSGLAAQLENGTFCAEWGFGLEEWLFSPKFDIDGWRCGYVQGVNKSRRRLLGQDIILFLFTIAPNMLRYYVGEIAPCRVLTNEETITAVNIFNERGLFNEMIDDIVDIDGNQNFITENLDNPELLNIRYQPSHLHQYQELITIPTNSILWRYNRYQLIELTDDQRENWIQNVRSKGLA